MKIQAKWYTFIISLGMALVLINGLLTRNLPQNGMKISVNTQMLTLRNANESNAMLGVLSWTTSSNEGEANFWPLIIIELILITIFAVMIVLKRRELKKAGLKFLVFVPLTFADEVVPKGGLIIILILGIILLFEVIYLSYLSLVSSRHAAEERRKLLETVFTEIKVQQVKKREKPKE